MHEYQGVFCKAVNSTDNVKIAGQGKNINAPKLAGPIVNRRGHWIWVLTRPHGPVGRGAGRPRLGLGALRMERPRQQGDGSTTRASSYGELQVDAEEAEVGNRRGRGGEDGVEANGGQARRLLGRARQRRERAACLLTPGSSA